MASPFDAHAARYDAVATSAVGHIARRRVHAVVDELLAPVSPASEATSSDARRVLDLGCGTGIDAVHLATAHGVQVVAVDASAAMVEHATARVAAAGVADRVEVVCADLDTVDVAAIAGGPVHLALSNFGVVNMVRDLDTLSRSLHQALVPAVGRAVLVPMARWCPPELAQGLVGLNRALLARRRGGAADDDYDGAFLRYLSGRELAAAFGAGWTLDRSSAVGTVLPTMEQRHLVEHRPRLRATLAALDDAVSGPAARIGLGDHHIAVLRPRSATREATGA